MQKNAKYFVGLKKIQRNTLNIGERSRCFFSRCFLLCSGRAKRDWGAL